jgi:hypothetical protein
MEPTRAHLIRLQRVGGTTADVYHNLGWTADDSHDRDKFVFNGTPFPSLGYQSDGPLFTGKDLLNRNISPGLSYTQNWLVGNSFTSGISGQAIAEYLMTNTWNSGVFFAPQIYIYHHGATDYETYSIWDYTNGVVPQDIPDIQAMGIFMIVAWRNNVADNVVIGPRFQVHTGGIPSANNIPIEPTNPLLRSSRHQSSNTLNFVLTPEDNPFVFSRTSIRLNENADLNSDGHNVHALRNVGNYLFHLYGTNLSREVLQQNVLPYTAPLAMLSVSPAAERMEVLLRVEGADNFATETVELYDRQTGQRQDLRTNNSYWFVMNPGDNADRFEVHFRRITTGDPDDIALPWQAYSFGGELIITDLSSSHQGAQVRIHNASGVLHIQQPIVNVPEERINIASLPTGVYLLSIEGRTVKFIK